MTLPVAVAGKYSKKLWQMMVISAGLSALFTTGGLALSYRPDLPPGATTILLAGGVYVAVNFVWPPARRIFRSIPRIRSRSHG
jgi:zinc transport system permease protein